MRLPSTPFNIQLMKLTPETLVRVPRISSPETYDGVTNAFHPQGLFSENLGAFGSEARDYLFGHIKLNTKIMHPIVCKWLKKVKRLNESIWRGEAYAIFDEKLGEFIECDVTQGGTGYHYFTSHLPKMKFKKNKSIKRTVIVDALERYRDRYFLEYYLVLPAGLRDIQQDENGRVTEDEINEMYRKMIRLSNSLANLPQKASAELDGIRTSMQDTANEIELYIEGILTGKKGFLLGKWASRSLHMSTRNVIAAQDPSAAELGSEGSVTVDTAQLGLFQCIAGIKPLLAKLLREFPLVEKALPTNDGYARVVDPTTLESKTVTISDDHYNEWMTLEGMEFQIKRFEKTSIRHLPVMIEGHYLGLIYKDDKKFQLLSDITELPPGWDKHLVKPITYVELFYLACSERLNQLMVQATRYPITGDGSIIICDLQCKTTIHGLTKEEYRDGQPLTPPRIFREYPDLSNPIYLEAATVPSSRLSGLGGDIKQTPTMSP